MRFATTDSSKPPAKTPQIPTIFFSGKVESIPPLKEIAIDFHC